MANTFSLSIKTPESRVLDISNAESLTVMTEAGLMVIKAHHASLTVPVRFSRIKVTLADSEMEYIAQRGMVFVSVERNCVDLLLYQCQEIKEIEYKTAEEYLKFVEEKLQNGENLNNYQLKYLENEKIAMIEQIKTLEKIKTPSA